jgi:hypothetical protein
MLGSSEWAGGLRDHVRHVSQEQRASVETELQGTIQRIESQIFPQHGLGDQPVRCGRAAKRG